MNHRIVLPLLLWTVSCAAPTPVVPAPARGEIERVVIVSVDGLRPADCARLPTLGALARQGTFAAAPEGALSVMPTVTYPSHTSMVTGLNPAQHGITTNSAPDPSLDGKNKAAWRWFRSEVRGRTLYDVALDAGLRTVLLNWPVSVGARASAIIPEFWMPGVEDGSQALRLLSSPGIFERIERHVPGFTARYTAGHVPDEQVIDAAIALLVEITPQLMLVHIVEVDGAQHEFGPDSGEADRARQHADAQVARLIEALRGSEAWPRSVLAIVSDHGFLPVTKQVAPMVLLSQRGLQERVWMISTGGTAYFYLQEKADREAETLTRQLFDQLSEDPGHGIGAVLDREAIAAMGGDADAFLAIEAVPGFNVSRERSGAPISETASGYRGTHGYLPQRPEMRATMLFYGPKIAPGALHGARLIDLAPTVANWLGLKLDRNDGTTLAVATRSGP